MLNAVARPMGIQGRPSGREGPKHAWADKHHGS